MFLLYVPQTNWRKQNCIFSCYLWSWNSSDSVATRLRAERLQFDLWQGLGNFLFATASRPALVPTEPPIQWIPGALPPGVKWQTQNICCTISILSCVRFVMLIWEFFCTPPCPDRLWGPPSLLFNGYRGCFPGGKATESWGWPFTSSLCRGWECMELYLHSPIRLHGVALS
jgi:hypothetical protein